MGNTCACFNEDNKDRDEFKSIVNKNNIKNEDVVKIQANFRGYKARKQYS